jgi:hypothetical protein
VTFSEPISTGAGYENITLKRGTTTVTTTKAISGNTLTITPTAAMPKNTSHSVTIPANAITDLAGNTMTANYSFSFKTGSK